MILGEVQYERLQYGAGAMGWPYPARDDWSTMRSRESLTLGPKCLKRARCFYSTSQASRPLRTGQRCHAQVGRSSRRELMQPRWGDDVVSRYDGAPTAWRL